MTLRTSDALPRKGAVWQWMLLPLRRYARFSGRSGRREFWWFSAMQFFFYTILIALVVSYFFFGIDRASSGSARDSLAVGFVAIFGFLAIFYIALFVPTLAVTVRRLHDIGISGWVVLPLYLAGWFLSFIGWIIYAVVMAIPGKDTANRYGLPVYDDQLATVFE